MSNDVPFWDERNTVLLSLDRARIEAYARKYGIPLPADDRVFWAGMHKARLEIPTMPQEAKEVSRQWLCQHGMRTRLGGKP